MGVTRNPGYLDIHISFLDMVRSIKSEELAIAERRFSHPEEESQAESNFRDRAILQLRHYKDVEPRLIGSPEGEYLNSLIERYEKD